MKIGVITFHYSDNYGAVLQTYALCRYLETLGHQPLVIDYVSVENKSKSRKSESWRDLAMELYIRQISRYSSFRLSGKFQYFRKKYLPISAEHYGSSEQLQKKYPNCDAYICGSDQIWNPHGIAFNPVYFLKFGPKSAKRISYAASFGTPVIEERLHKKLRDCLSELDSISVREQSGTKIIRDVAQKKSECVLDPTLLLDDYHFVLNDNKFGEGYLLVYRLQQAHGLTKALTRIIRTVSKKMRMKVINVSPHRYRFFLETGKTVYPTPPEWLSLFANSGFVITNSFHGTVFAILNRKPFFSFPRVNDAGQNARIEELLCDIGLQDRYVTPQTEDSYLKERLTCQINWDDIYFKLSALRDKSRLFLQHALCSEDDCS